MKMKRVEISYVHDQKWVDAGYDAAILGAVVNAVVDVEDSGDAHIVSASWADNGRPLSEDDLADDLDGRQHGQNSRRALIVEKAQLRALGPGAFNSPF